MSDGWGVVIHQVDDLVRENRLVTTRNLEAWRPLQQTWKHFSLGWCWHSLRPLDVWLCWEQQQTKIETLKKSALESYWTVNPLSVFFFFSWLVYWCLVICWVNLKGWKKELDQKCLYLCPLQSVCQNFLQNPLAVIGFSWLSQTYSPKVWKVSK